MNQIQKKRGGRIVKNMNEEKNEKKPEGEVKQEEIKEVKPIVPEKIAKPKECPICNKNMDKKWYYRDGAFYCGKGCWKKTKKKAGADQETKKK